MPGTLASVTGSRFRPALDAEQQLGEVGSALTRDEAHANGDPGLREQGDPEPAALTG